jgi:predicted dienelactone hydrolase
VFSQGYDVAAEIYAPLLHDWAASGYVVVDPTYPFTDPQAPEGIDEQDIVNHPADLRFVLSAVLQASASPQGVLSGLINPNAVALIGHSDGAEVTLATAANSCCRDPRVRAAIILSGSELPAFGGTYYASGSVPLLVVQGTQDAINPQECSIDLYDAAPPPKYYLSLLDVDHLSPYTDAGPDQSVVERVALDFLNGYLKDESAAIGDIAHDGLAPQVSTISTDSLLDPVGDPC